MAITGLQNSSVLESAFPRDSQSQASRQQLAEGRPGTQASSILQMWRDLEDEHVVRNAEERLRERLRQQRSDGFNDDLTSTGLWESQGSEYDGGLREVDESDYETWSGSQMGSPNENKYRDNSCQERSSEFGEVERERVRQVFQEWMNIGGREHTSSIPTTNNSPRAQWLGENECERVRIIRERIQMNCQRRGYCRDNSEDQTAEMVTQIDRVRDGLVVNHNDGRANPIQRRIRRLCGRQALLDMLVKAERERQRELQELLEHRAVSHFPHRNRIQSLLKGRFLRNERVREDQRPNSTAAGELGLLRQRQPVSGLREGFLSRLDNCAHGAASSNKSDMSSNSDNKGYRNEEAQGNSSQEIPDEVAVQYGPTNEESNINRLSDCIDGLEVNTVEDLERQASSRHEEGWHEEVSENEEGYRQQVVSVQFNEGRDAAVNMGESTAVEIVQDVSGIEGGEHSHRQEIIEVFHEHPGNEEGNFHGLLDNTNNHEGSNVEDINWQDSTAQVEGLHEQATDNGERDQLHLAVVEFSDFSGAVGEEMNGNWLGNTVNTWSQDMNDVGRPIHLPETPELWHEGGSQEAVENWSDGPSEQEAVPGARDDSFYLPDDDSVHGTEIRELLSRRSVSNLLQSGFRESLDQLIQSYVERQSNDSADWEPDGVPPSPASSAEQEQEQQNRDQNEYRLDAIDNSLDRPPQPVLPQPLWDRALGQDNWPQHNMHQRLGIEWETINDLRIDMSRLQQRMNNMQKMLESCMDMQLELHRSIRQEVSAALNRSAGSPGLCKDGVSNEGSNWDQARKGICCICCNSSIDTLLYRCGHMCTCLTCSNQLVQDRGRCPMCGAPVVEAIRAYSIL